MQEIILPMHLHARTHTQKPNPAHINKAASTINLWGPRELSLKAKVKRNTKIAVQQKRSQLSKGPLLKSHLPGKVSCAFSCFGHLTLALQSNWPSGLQTK